MPKNRAEIEAEATVHAMTLQPIIAELMATGITSKLGIANKLNSLGVTTQRGGTWTYVQVGTLLARINSGKPD